MPDMVMTTQYEENGLFSKIIDAPAEEAIKHGFELGIKAPETEEYITTVLENLDFETAASIAIKWSRLYGGAIAVMLIDDGGGIDEPLNIKNIRKIDEIRVYERPIVVPDSTYLHNSKNYGQPEYFDVSSMYGNYRVHASRCLVFKNGILPELTSQPQYRFWGIPEYVRIKKELQNTAVAHGTAPKLLDRSVQAIYKMKDLAMTLEHDGGEDIVMKRLQAIDMARGILSSVTIDAEGEDYDFKNIAFGGVKEVIDVTCNMLSAVTNIPQTVLFGRSPAGENATGDSDFEGWYNYVERIQKLMLKANLTKLIDIILRAGVAQGEIEEVPQIKLAFNKLWSMSEEEQTEMDSKKASTQQTKAATAQTYVDMGALDPKEVRKALAADEEFMVEDILDELDEVELWGEEGYENWEGEPPEQGEQPPDSPTEETSQDDSALEKLKENWNQPEQPDEEDDVDEQNEAFENLKSAFAIMKLKEAWNTGEDFDSVMERIKNDLSERNEKRSSFSKLKDAWNKSKALKMLKWNWGKENPKMPSANKDRGDDDTRIGVGVLVVKNGKVLVGKRSDNGQLCGPGGHVKDNESLPEAAVRETEEEFGIVPKNLTPLSEHIFLCTEYDGKPHCTDGEMSSPRYVDPEVLLTKGKELLFPPFKHSLELLATQGKSGNPLLTNTDDYYRINVDTNIPDDDVIFRTAANGKKYAINTETGETSGLGPDIDSDNQNQQIRESALKRSGENAAKDSKLQNVDKSVQDAYDTARKNEKDITPDVYDIAKDCGADLEKLESSVKTASSVMDKIQRDERDYGYTPEQSIAKMDDIVRYTMSSDHNSIAGKAESAIEGFKAKGYDVTSIENTWNDKDPPYKGLLARVTAPNGQTFEVQFHSPQTLSVLREIHPYYEIARNVKTPLPEAIKQANKCADRSATLKTPYGMNSAKLQDMNRVKNYDPLAEIRRKEE